MSGAFRIFRVAGIQVYLHFTWFLVAWYEISSSKYRYQSVTWAVAEYVGLFAIVLLHEFGHAFACRSSGGRAERIVLWPLGGLAFVDPPPRPGAVLWSIAAGPLINVVLYPFLHLLLFSAGPALHNLSPDLLRLVYNIWRINLGLLIFNLLPVFPLDGGQIVRALLWFKLGPIRSLKIAGMLGVIGSILLGGLALFLGGVSGGSLWLVLIAFFLLSQAMAAIQRANAIALQTNIAAVPPPPPDQHQQRP
jgi:Zn-dependent protease